MKMLRTLLICAVLIPAAALALIIQSLFDLLDRVVVPAGLRKAASQHTA